MHGKKSFDFNGLWDSGRHEAWRKILKTKDFHHEDTKTRRFWFARCACLRRTTRRPTRRPKAMGRRAKGYGPQGEASPAFARLRPEA
ncbi:MAG: hypothetical protein OES41_08365, partial [Rhodospirillales bacterium]|nr:hypothetical protein [Rhodospirillales bacterium]